MIWGFPGATGERVLWMWALGGRFEALLGLGGVGVFLLHPGVKPFLDLLSGFAGKPPWVYRLWLWLSGLGPALVAGLPGIFVPLVLDAVPTFGGIGMNYPTFSRVQDNGRVPPALRPVLAQKPEL